MTTHIPFHYSTRYGRMVIAKETIEREARAAAQAGHSLNDACPYPWDTDAAMHFKAVYLLALGASAVQHGGAA